jgi:hypothetical protein
MNENIFGNSFSKKHFACVYALCMDDIKNSFSNIELNFALAKTFRLRNISTSRKRFAWKTFCLRKNASLVLNSCILVRAIAFRMRAYRKESKNPFQASFKKLILDFLTYKTI